MGGRPFLEVLIREISRYGVTEILLLAAFLSELVEAFAHSLPDVLGTNIRVETVAEVERTGTGGALYFARPKLADRFLMMNGDSLFDIDLTALSGLLDAAENAAAAVALRAIPSAGRYDSVVLDGSQVLVFGQKGARGPVLINAGVYSMSRDVVSYRSCPGRWCS